MAVVHEGRMLGTGIRVAVLDAMVLQDVVEVAIAELDALDRACSRFREDSDLSLVNRQAGSWVQVQPLLLGALDAALEVARFTAGAVDPTVGRAMRAIGYDRDFAHLTDTGPLLLTVRPVPGWSTIKLDRSHSRVWIPGGTELDLGSTAKAWAADRIARLAHAKADTGVLISLGGDIAVAGPAPRGGWTVLCAEDHAADLSSAGQLVAIHRGALATSSTRVRTWRRGGAVLHHIIDPSTGLPAPERWRTVSVAADSCLYANAAATACIVLGRDALGWLDALALSARLVDECGSVILRGGWPASEEQAGE